MPQVTRTRRYIPADAAIAAREQAEELAAELRRVLYSILHRKAAWSTHLATCAACRATLPPEQAAPWCELGQGAAARLRDAQGRLEALKQPPPPVEPPPATLF